jgi:hypothetical protein
MNLKIGKVFTNKFVGTGTSSFEKRIYQSTVSQRLRNTDLHHGVQPSRSESAVFHLTARHVELRMLPLT